MTRASAAARRWHWHAALLALTACGSAPPVQPPTSPSLGAASPTAPAPSSTVAPSSTGPTLLDEERRLAALFDGTPVAFSMQSGNALRVDVPLRFCFDSGRDGIKPPLAAVLDRLAQSQRDRTSRFVVSASADGPVRAQPAASSAAQRRAASAPSSRGAGHDVSTLATRRASGLRDRLVAQGIDPARTTVVESDAPGIRIVVSDAPAP